MQCEQPNNSLYTFTGNLIVQKQTLPLSPNQILLRVRFHLLILILLDSLIFSYLIDIVLLLYLWFLNSDHQFNEFDSELLQLILPFLSSWWWNIDILIYTFPWLSCLFHLISITSTNFLSVITLASNICRDVVLETQSTLLGQSFLLGMRQRYPSRLSVSHTLVSSLCHPSELL